MLAIVAVLIIGTMERYENMSISIYSRSAIEMKRVGVGGVTYKISGASYF
jgi:hypothetical protein